MLTTYFVIAGCHALYLRILEVLDAWVVCDKLVTANL